MLKIKIFNCTLELLKPLLIYTATEKNTVCIGILSYLSPYLNL